MTYPLKLRQHVLQDQKAPELTYKQTAQRFGIGVNTLVRWHGRLEPITQRQVSPYKVNSQALLEDVQQYPDAYNYERALRLGVSTGAIFYALRRLGISRKKRPLSILKPASRPKSDFKTKSLIGKDKKGQLSIDESGFAQDKPRAHGYSHKGTRCLGKKDWGAKGRTNVIGALLGKTLLCSCLLECNVDSEGISYLGYTTTAAPHT